MPDLSDQLIERVLSASADKTPLYIQGRSSKYFYGRAIPPQDIANTVDVTAHSGIVSYRADELVMTVRAGTALSEIRQTLDASQQMLSFEPPDFAADASIGGSLACNQSGPARPWRGSVRDSVLGVRLINGRGEHLRFGGQVIKNVAGYDVSRLQAGAMGTLGLLTEISFKTVPKPALAAYAQIPEDSADVAIAIMNQLSSTPLPISGACWLRKTLHLRFEGAADGVAGALAYCQKHWPNCTASDDGAEFWEGLREQQLDYFNGDRPLWRLSVNSAMPALTPEEDWLIDWGGAQRWVRGNFDHAYWQEKIPAGKGQASLFRHGDRSAEVFPLLPAPTQALHKRLKSAFDPHHIFNQHRLYSWL